MKIITLLLSSLFVMAGCSTHSQPTEESSVVLEEMNKEKAMIHLEEITYRFVNASLDENGSFDQKSEAQAGLSRIESERADITVNYDTSEPKVSEILSIAEWTEKALKEMLAEDFNAATGTAEIVGGEISEYSKEYLDGELPPTLKTMLRIEELKNQ